MVEPWTVGNFNGFEQKAKELKSMTGEEYVKILLRCSRCEFGDVTQEEIVARLM